MKFRSDELKILCYTIMGLYAKTALDEGIEAPSVGEVVALLYKKNLELTEEINGLRNAKKELT